jgi:hypothetical protein
MSRLAVWQCFIRPENAKACNTMVSLQGNVKVMRNERSYDHEKYITSLKSKKSTNIIR